MYVVLQSHPHFRTLIDTNATLWSTASFQNVWPTMPNLKHFKRCAFQLVLIISKKVVNNISNVVTCLSVCAHEDILL